MFIVVAWMQQGRTCACTWLLDGTEEDVKEAEKWVTRTYPNSGKVYTDIKTLKEARERVRSETPTNLIW